jgi:hypothetical protein
MTYARIQNINGKNNIVYVKHVCLEHLNGKKEKRFFGVNKSRKALRTIAFIKTMTGVKQRTPGLLVFFNK